MIFACCKNQRIVMKICVLNVMVFLVLTGCLPVNNKTEGENYPQTSLGEKKAPADDNLEDEFLEDDLVEQDTLEIPIKNEKKIYFKATGSEPFWGLEIADSGIQFTSLMEGFESFSVPFIYPEKAADANVKKYHLETEQSEMHITVSQQECANTMSGYVSAYMVEVEIKDFNEESFTNFSGCGAYAMDEALESYWILETIGQIKIDTLTFTRNIPHIKIQVEANTFTGFAGCNNIRGNLFSEVEILRFMDVVSTKKMCGQASVEDQFLEALKVATTYKLSGRNLQLKNPSRILMQFRKSEE